MHSDHVLRVVMYDYIRDLPRTPFPKLPGMLLNDFRLQIEELSKHFEMASLECATDFMTGEYRPRRDLCLLTFDDGFKEHFRDITPILAEKRIRGVFFVITSCLEERKLAAVHMNDFLMAALDFEEYSAAFLRQAVTLSADGIKPFNADLGRAEFTYPWDTPEVARFKYLFNFGIDPELRDRVVHDLFTRHISDEASFAGSLYITWEEARKMQRAGMVIAGHAHQHRPLANLSARDLTSDLETCSKLLHQHLLPQPVWAFSYPYGKMDSFHIRAVRKLQQLGFRCGFSTESSDNRRGGDLFTIGRTDCRKAVAASAAGA